MNHTMEFSSRIKRRQRRNIVKSMGNQTFEDVTFVVGQNRAEFKGNRFLMAIISDVFKAMLFGSMQESNANAVIDISDTNANGFQSVLNFAYLRDPEITAENVVSVKNICRKYSISDLDTECDEYFDFCLSPSTICLLLDQSITHKIDEYVQKCSDKMNEIGKRSLEILQSNGFIQMGLESISVLLQSEFLRIKEEEIWDAVLKWAERQSSKEIIGDIDEEPAAKRRRLNHHENRHKDNILLLRLLNEVKPYIRFGLMDSKYFSERVESIGFLSKDEVIAVFKYMAMKQEDPKYQCGAFNTRPRRRMIHIDARVKKFDLYSPTYHRTSNGGANICGRSFGLSAGIRACYGRWIYPETSQPEGYSSGVHFWSLKMVRSYNCHHDIAIVSERKSIEEINASKATTSETVSYYKESATWNRAEVITVVLDCDKGEVCYYINNVMHLLKLKQRDHIEANRRYFFAMILCGTNLNQIDVVNTPRDIVAIYGQ